LVTEMSGNQGYCSIEQYLSGVSEMTENCATPVCNENQRTTINPDSCQDPPLVEKVYH